MAQQNVSAPRDPERETSESLRVQQILQIMQKLEADTDTQASWGALTAAERAEDTRLAIKGLLLLYRREIARR